MGTAAAMGLPLAEFAAVQVPSSFLGGTLVSLVGV